MPPVTNQQVLDRITSVETKVDSMDRLIRGHNGELGLQARFLMLEKYVEPLQKLDRYFIDLRTTVAVLSNNVDTLAKSVNKHQEIEALADKTTPLSQMTPQQKQDVKDTKDAKDFGTWIWFRDVYLDKIIATIVTVVLTSIAIYVLQKAFGIP